MSSDDEPLGFHPDRIMEDDAATTYLRPDENPSSFDDGVTTYTRSASEQPLVDDGTTVYLHPEKAAPPGDGATVYRAPESPREEKPSRPAPPSAAPSAYAAPGLPRVGDEVLGGRYRLLEELRHGAQSFAFKAKELVSENYVLVKISKDRDPSGRAFQQQISVRDNLMALRHRNLMRCFHVAIERDRLVEVCEFLEGQGMTSWMEARKRFDNDEIRSVVAQLGAGIHALQTEGHLAHRDLKPDNILVLPNAEPFLLKIVDYGIVCRIGAGGLTAVAGTRYYSPPEYLGRTVENNELLASWDWWSLGRIVQRLIDGVEISTRLEQLAARHMEASDSDRSSTQHIFDQIMLEQNRRKWHMRAGMVELLDSNPAAKPWLALLRGLLTTNCSDRWGYGEVRRFLANEAVEEKYTLTAEAAEFRFQNAFWDIAGLAKYLIQECSSLPGDYLAPGTGAPRGQDLWEQAKDLVRNGEILRYVRKVLQNVDLDRDLERLSRIPDRDLGTALALVRLAEEQETPRVKNALVNRRFVLNLADRNEARAREMLQVLLAPAYLQEHRRLHPGSGAELEQLVSDLKQLRARLGSLGVQSGSQPAMRLPDDLLLQKLALCEDQAVKAIAEFRGKLARTANAPLEDLFSRDASRLSQMDKCVLLVALADAPANKFISYETLARELQSRGNRLRNALALNRCAFALSPKLKIYNGPFGNRALIAAGAGILLLYLAPFQIFRFGSAVRLFTFNLPLIFVCVAVALLYGFSSRWLKPALRKDIASLDPEMAAFANWTPQNLAQLAGQWAAPESMNRSRLNQQLSALNRQIAKMPGIKASLYRVGAPPFLRTKAVVASQTLLLLLLLFLGPISRFVLRTPLNFGARSSTAAPIGVGKTIDGHYDGKPMKFQVLEASAVSGSNGNHRKTLIFSRPVVVENGDVHDATLHSTLPIVINGSARNADLNAGPTMVVVNGALRDSTMIADKVRVGREVVHSRLVGHTVSVGGSVDKSSTLERVPPHGTLPPPRRY